MKVNVNVWRREKLAFWKRLREDLEIGYLDRELLPLILLINMDAELYSTSSCSGRLIVMDAETPWSREETSTIFKSHVPVKPGDLEFMYTLRHSKNLWLIVSGPIIHISALKAKRAMEVLRIARSSGFKHSGIMHVSTTKGFFVELVTGIHVAQLIKTRDRVVVPKEELDVLVELFNRFLLECKHRLQKLYLSLKSILPKVVDEELEQKALKTFKPIISKTPLDIFFELCRERKAQCS